MTLGQSLIPKVTDVWVTGSGGGRALCNVPPPSVFTDKGSRVAGTTGSVYQSDLGTDRHNTAEA